MAPGSVRALLQRLVLLTQFPPFIWLYRFAYRIAVRLSARRLGRLRGVRAVYLRRGLASGEAFYGMSDVDLLVMVDDSEGSTARNRARHQYELLRRLFPVLAEGELAVYSPAEFRLLYESVPFYRNRFDRGRRGWRRLYGEDVFAALPAAGGDGRGLAGEELGPAWRYLSAELLPPDPRPAYQRRYVAHKVVADAARAALLAAGRDAGTGRAEALTRAAAAFPQWASLLASATAWRRTPLRGGPLPVDDLIRCFLDLANKAQVAAREEVGAGARLRLRAAAPESVEAVLGSGALELMSEACAKFEDADKLVLVPRLSFSPLARVGLVPDQMIGATVDAFDLVIVGGEIPSAHVLRTFNRELAGLRPRVIPFFCDGTVLVPLVPIEGRTVADASTRPEVFAAIAAADRFDDHLCLAGAVEFEACGEALGRRARDLLELFADPEVYRLPTRSFFTLLWEAGRAAVVGAGLSREAVDVPATSTQVIDALSRITPEHAAVLGEIRNDYVRRLAGEPSRLFTFTAWAGAYACELASTLFGSERARRSLPATPRAVAGISVVVATRNRAAVLRRALDSLVAQQRGPQQVVVVDNASDDDTAEVARSFADRLPVEVVREETVGVAHARSAGVRRCTQDLVAFMDDDCEAAPDWLAELEVPFLRDPFLGAVGGSVLPVGDQEGLVAGFYRSRMSRGRPPEGKAAS